jgi:hypothetical protein
MFLAACGEASSSTSSPMQVGAGCPFGDTSLQVEEGHYLLAPASTVAVWRSLTPQQVCQRIVSDWLQLYRGEYEVRFGQIVLSKRVVRLRKTRDLRDTGLEGDYEIGGHTYSDAIDLGAESTASLPHELNHIRTGSGHSGWCIDFEPWSEQVLGINQRVYLGCH